MIQYSTEWENLFNFIRSRNMTILDGTLCSGLLKDFNLWNRETAVCRALVELLDSGITFDRFHIARTQLTGAGYSSSYVDQAIRIWGKLLGADENETASKMEQFHSTGEIGKLEALFVLKPSTTLLSQIAEIDPEHRLVAKYGKIMNSYYRSLRFNDRMAKLHVLIGKIQKALILTFPLIVSLFLLQIQQLYSWKTIAFSEPFELFLIDKLSLFALVAGILFIWHRSKRVYDEVHWFVWLLLFTAVGHFGRAFFVPMIELALSICSFYLPGTLAGNAVISLIFAGLWWKRSPAILKWIAATNRRTHESISTSSTGSLTQSALKELVTGLSRKPKGVPVQLFYTIIGTVAVTVVLSTAIPSVCTGLCKSFEHGKLLSQPSIAIELPVQKQENAISNPLVKMNNRLADLVILKNPITICYTFAERVFTGIIHRLD